MNALRFGGAIVLFSDGRLPWSSNRSNSVCVAFFMLITPAAELFELALSGSLHLAPCVGQAEKLGA